MANHPKTELHRQWASLGQRKPPATPTRPVRMRDVPGVADIERKVGLYSNARGELEHSLEDRVNALCREIFGVSSPETEFQYPPDFDHLSDEKRWPIEWQRDQHEEQFETATLGQADQVALLLRLGLDFSNGEGDPLRCLPHFARAAEAAAKQMKGFTTKMPTQEEASNAAFEDKLAAEAAAFQRSRHKR
jgi:hypothetical protein